MINRNIIVVLFILLISLGVGINAILYINGYRIDFKNGSTNLVKGGNLSISTDPKNAEIYVDGKLIGTSPYTFSNLEPGQYQIEMKKENYTDWNDTVVVTEGYVSNLNITLFPTNQAISTIETDFVIKSVIHSFLDKGLFLIESEEGDLWLADINKSLLRRNISFKKILHWEDADFSSFSYEIDDSGDNILVKDNENSIFYALTTLGTTSSLASSELEFRVDVDGVIWGDNFDNLLIESGDLVFSYNRKNDNYLLLHNKSKNPIYSINRNGMTYIDEQTIIFRNTENSIQKTIELDKLKSEDNFDAITTNNTNNIILLISGQKLYMLNTEEMQLIKLSDTYSAVYGLNFSPDENKVVFSNTDNTLFSYVIDNNMYLGKQRLNKIGKQNKCVWRSNSENLLCIDDEGKLNIMDYDGSNNTIIMSDKTLLEDLLANKNDEIYVFETNESIQMLKIDLTKPSEGN